MRVSLITNIPGVWPLPSAGVAPDPVVLILSGLAVAGALAAVVLAVVLWRRWLLKPAPAPYSGIGAVQPYLAGRHSWSLAGDAEQLSASDARAAETAWGA